jgi:hypothetical protein
MKHREMQMPQRILHTKTYGRKGKAAGRFVGNSKSFSGGF